MAHRQEGRKIAENTGFLYYRNAAACPSADAGWDLQYADPEHAAALARNAVDSVDALLRGWAALTLAAYWQKNGQSQPAALMLARARRSFAAAGHARGTWLTAALEATQALAAGDVTAALTRAEGLLAHPPPTGHELDLHHIHQVLSFCHKRLGNIEGGLRWLYTDLALVREHQARPQQAVVLLNLAAYLMRIEEWPEAKACLLEAATLAAALPNGSLLRRIDLNLALCARALNDREEALQLTRRALADPECDPGSTYSLYGNAAALHVQMGDLDAARTTLAEAWAVARAGGLPIELAECHCIDGQIAAAEGRIDAAVAALETSALIAKRVSDVHAPVQTTILRLLADYLARRGDTQRAYAIHQRFFAANEARHEYMQRARLFAARARHEVETMRLERDQARVLQQQREATQRAIGALNARLGARAAEIEALRAQLQEQADHGRQPRTR
ncbi:MAG: hypothetical protein ABI624_15110 [Casimicrobiaceae bacterium]